MSKFRKLLHAQHTLYAKVIDTLQIDEKSKSVVRGSWLNAIDVMEALCKRHLTYHDLTNVLLIVFSALVPVIMNIPVKEGRFDTPKLISTILGMLVAILHGVRQSYKFSERFKNFRKTSEMLKIEGDRFFSLGGPYNGLTYQTAFPAFITNVTNIRNEQIIEYVQKIVSVTEEGLQHAPEGTEVISQQGKEDMMKREIEEIRNADTEVTDVVIDHQLETITFTTITPGHLVMKDGQLVAKDGKYTFQTPGLKKKVYNVKNK